MKSLADYLDASASVASKMLLAGTAEPTQLEEGAANKLQQAPTSSDAVSQGAANKLQQAPTSSDAVSQALSSLLEACSVLEEQGNKLQQAQAAWIRACLSLTSESSSLVKLEKARLRGEARANALTPERRSEIARIAARASAQVRKRRKASIGFEPNYFQHD